MVRPARCGKDDGFPRAGMKAAPHAFNILRAGDQWSGEKYRPDRSAAERWHRAAEHPGVLEIDDQLERRPLLNPVMSKITIKPGASVATAAAMLVFAFDCIHGIHHCDISGAGGGYGAVRGGAHYHMRVVGARHSDRACKFHFFPYEVLANGQPLGGEWSRRAMPAKHNSKT